MDEQCIKNAIQCLLKAQSVIMIIGGFLGLLGIHTADSPQK